MPVYAGIGGVVGGMRREFGSRALALMHCRRCGGVEGHAARPAAIIPPTFLFFLTFVRYFNLARCRLLLRKDLWTWLSCSPALAVLGLG